jgi:hypothetical protein
MSKKIYSMIDKFLEEDKTIDEVKQLADELAFSNNPTYKTISTRYSLMKKYLREKYGNKFSEAELKIIKPIDEITNALLARDVEKRAEKKNITYDDELLDKILDLKDNYKNDYELAIYLQFISGRRVDEIKDPKYIVKTFKNDVKMNLSKTKDNEFKLIKLIPNTISAKEFKLKVDQLRNRNNDVSSNDWNKRLNKAVKRSVRNDLTSHNLRGLYAGCMFERHNENNKNINGLITEVLNHKTPDASLSYSNYKYKNKNDKVLEDIVENGVGYFPIEK